MSKAKVYVEFEVEGKTVRMEQEQARELFVSLKALFDRPAPVTPAHKIADWPKSKELFPYYTLEPQWVPPIPITCGQHSIAS